MKVIFLQCKNHMVLTTSQEVALVTKEVMSSSHDIVIVQEFNLANGFKVKDLSLLNLHSSILEITGAISITSDISINFSASILYDYKKVEIGSIIMNYHGNVIESMEVIEVLKNAVGEYVNYEFKPQIHDFYKQLIQK